MCYATRCRCAHCGTIVAGRPDAFKHHLKVCKEMLK